MNDKRPPFVITDWFYQDGLECEGCGTIIKTGRFCEKCKRKMETDFQSVIKKKPVEPQLDKRPKERDKMRYL